MKLQYIVIYKIKELLKKYLKIQHAHSLTVNSPEILLGGGQEKFHFSACLKAASVFISE